MFIKLSETYLTIDTNIESVKLLDAFLKLVMHITHNSQICTFLLNMLNSIMYIKLRVFELLG